MWSWSGCSCVHWHSRRVCNVKVKLCTGFCITPSTLRRLDHRISQYLKEVWCSTLMRHRLCAYSVLSILRLWDVGGHATSKSLAADYAELFRESRGKWYEQHFVYLCLMVNTDSTTEQGCSGALLCSVVQICWSFNGFGMIWKLRAGALGLWHIGTRCETLWHIAMLWPTRPSRLATPCLRYSVHGSSWALRTTRSLRLLRTGEATAKRCKESKHKTGSALIKLNKLWEVVSMSQCEFARKKLKFVHIYI